MRQWTQLWDFYAALYTCFHNGLAGSESGQTSR